MSGGNNGVEYEIGAKDETGGAITAALGKIKDLSKATVAEAHKVIEAFRSRSASIKRSLAMETDALRKAHKSALSVYETLDEINKRVDAPKEAARAQEEHNKALERWCALLERAKQREEARHAKWNFYNAFDKDTHGNLEKLHGEDGGGTGGTKAANDGIKDMASSARRATGALMLMSHAMGSADGAAGKMANAISGVAGMAVAFGPVGAAIAGVQAAIGAVADYFVDKANKMLEKAKELGAKMTLNLSKLKEVKFDSLVSDLARVAKATDRAADAFDRMAKAKEALTAAENRTAAASDSSEIADMKRQMAEDVVNSSEDDKDRIAAAWKYKIAEKEAELTERSAERQLQADEESLHLAEERLALTERNAAKLEEAAARAMKEHDMMRDLFGETDKNYVKQYETAAKQAKERADAAHVSVERQRDELEALRQNKAAADIERGNRVSEAHTATISAESEYRSAEDRKAKKDEQTAREAAEKIARQQKEYDDKRLKDERDARMRLEHEIAAERKRLSREISDSQRDEAAARDRLAAAQSAVHQAWGWYRDKDSLKAQLEEEKTDAEAEKQFEKDFDKLKFRRDWREAKNLSLDQEAVRRVALAREEEKAAQEYAKQTADASQRAADALEAIEAAFEGGGQ